MNSEMYKDVLNSAEMMNQLNLVSSRAEALSIVVNILNAALSIIQKSDTPLSTDCIAAIQSAINAEDNKTNELLAKIEQSMNADRELKKDDI